MTPSPVPQASDAITEKKHRNWRLSQAAFVWSVWLFLIVLNLAALARYSQNVPITEDWYLIRAFTGNEANLTTWLWSQINEHRVPLPKLVMLGALKITRGEYRSVQLLNIGLLAFVAAALMRASASIRAGRYSFADCAFPLVLLHFGHAENLLWAWQITFVLFVTLVLVILIVLVTPDNLSNRRLALVAGLVLVSLSLTGAAGLMFVPPIACWFIFRGYVLIRGTTPERHTGLMLLVTASAALAITMIYFVGYESPAWTGPPTTVLRSLWSAALNASFIFGPVSRGFDSIAIAVTVLLLLATAAVIVRAVAVQSGSERMRAAGLMIFFGVSAAYMLAIGYARSGTALFIFHEWPTRYAVLATPLFCCVFLIWRLYGPDRFRTLLTIGLATLLLVLLPLNTAHGRAWLEWPRAAETKLSTDVTLGLSPVEVARRNRPLVPVSMNLEETRDCLRFLRDAGVHPFREMGHDTQTEVKSGAESIGSLPETNVSYEERDVTYELSGAEGAVLVWGINGWKSIPERLRPPNTTLENHTMRTVLERRGTQFTTRLRIPHGSTIDLGVLITRCAGFGEIQPVYDDLFPPLVPRAKILELRSRLRCEPDGTVVFATASNIIKQQFRYQNPSAGEVWLIWGVNGWHRVETGLLGPENMSTGRRVITPMKRTGQWFTAEVQIPSGSKIDYGFLVTRGAGWHSTSHAVWDAPKMADIATADERLVYRSPMRVKDPSVDFIPTVPQCLLGVSILILIWIALSFKVAYWTSPYHGGFPHV